MKGQSKQKEYEERQLILKYLWKYIWKPTSTYYYSFWGLYTIVSKDIYENNLNVVIT